MSNTGETALTAWVTKMHAMGLLQVYQASSDPGVMQELWAATDLALQATKVTGRSLGRAVSTLVVQECHMWLNLADMHEPD